MLLYKFLDRFVREGRLILVDPEGKEHAFGDDTGETVRIRVDDRATLRRLFATPKMALGEAYMDGRLTVDGGDVFPLIDLLTRNLGVQEEALNSNFHRITGLILRRLHQFNPLGRAQRNVAHHYDLSDTLYDLFLDADRQYSCAYFPEPGLSIDEAQQAKKRHIAAKLRLEPGQKVLDIGCGWGGLGLYIAHQDPTIEVVGVTLSKEQHAVANRRAREAGVADRVRFELMDYRALEDASFDRIVSVGMFEHVGVPHYQEFFDKVRALLTEDGVALLHTIGRVDGPGSTNPWIRKYIFPGGYCPALSEVMSPIERARLWTTDVEILRLHYAETLLAWRERFKTHWDRVAEVYDERFCRMWEFYLAGSECAFRNSGHVVFQIQFAKRVDALPITRDYMIDREREEQSREADVAA
ncbi:MAG: cyclopropane-fatty-acyl-phospholipid synthase family protein [Azospirillaceae bacterium]